MATLDAIWDRARTDLIIRSGAGGEDVTCWENARRTAQSTLRLSRLTELRSLPIDTDALLAAALYHDVVTADRLRRGLLSQHALAQRGLALRHREQSAARMHERLADLLAEEVLTRASEAILTLHDRETASLEGRILSDARNLNDIGLLSLWPVIRRSMIEGRGVESLIETWKRQEEYRFWEARIDEAFHFETVRRLAERRLARFNEFVAEVARLHHGLDITD